MSLKKLDLQAAALEKAAAAAEKAGYKLRLYVSGATPNSTRALANIRRICEQHLAGRYELEIIDVYQNPALAVEDQIIALPTLVKKMPKPIHRLIGDMSNEQRVLAGLNLIAKI
jgi:circadian clock protein KaiB